MMEFWHLYVSGFWPWLGITVGIAVIANGAALLVAAVVGKLR